MSGTLTRGDIRSVRDSLSLSVRQLAALLGVSPSTAYRWEGTDAEDAKPEDVLAIDPMQHDLLQALRKVVEADPSENSVEAFSKRLADALKEGGTLQGLHELLHEIYAGTAKG